MTDTHPAALRELLREHQQEHLLRWIDALGAQELAALSAEIASVDFPLIRRLFAETAGSGSSAREETPADRARRATPPARIIRLPRTPEERADREKAAVVGRDALKAGKVGVVLVAGGQGTRLGFDQPKGMFPIGPVSGATLYQILAEQVLARSRRAQVAIPYFVMTSDATHAETSAFFAEHDYFGLNRRDVFFFQQGTMPAVDANTGRVLLAEKSRIAASPDGHGGLIRALSRAGLFDEMRRRGIEYLYYHQVDNPTAIVCDPAFLGWHILWQSEVSTKVIAKRAPEEKTGLLMDVDGKTCIIEYSDLPDDVARMTDSSGGLLHWAGNTAIHVFDRAFLESIAGSDAALPYHSARKKVPHINDLGELVEPDAPNAIKFERFIFDVIPQATRPLVVEADRAREFNPVKNASGDDSPETSRKAICEIHGEWLRQSGANVPAGALVEISPLVALDAEDVGAQIRTGNPLSFPLHLPGK
ncbi:MAG: UTP--glucose-1-phosphate uridylyltransferase [Planctomycetaceae bacterium]